MATDLRGLADGEWNDGADGPRQGGEEFGDLLAAALSLPFTTAGGEDGQIFHSGFMALQPVSGDECVDGASDGPFDYRGYMALQPLSPRSASRACADASASSSPPLDPSPSHVMAVKFPDLRPGAMVFLGDTGAAVHGVKSDEHVYNRRALRPDEHFLKTANGHLMQVSCFGDLDINFHSDLGGVEQDRIVTLEGIAVTPGLMLNLNSFNQLQRKQSIMLDETGAWLLGHQVHFSYLGNGNYIQGIRVPPHEPDSPPAMAVAVIRPGKQKCMNINDLHHSLAHRNAATLRETAKQLGIKVTSLLEFCDFCSEAKAFKVAVPRSLPLRRLSKRPLYRIAIGLAGIFAASLGGSKFMMMILDLFTNYGRTEFLPDKSASVIFAFKRWRGRVKRHRERYGEIEYMLTDNGNEFTNADFRRLLVDEGITAELTSVDGPKSNGQVERRIDLVMEGGRAAWLGFKHLFPGIVFPPPALNYQMIWPECARWMSHAHNLCAEMTKEDKRSPELHGKVTSLVLPLMMPGFRHDPRRNNKLVSKGERCFYLGPGEDHSSATCRIMLATGRVNYSAHVTFGFYRRPFTMGDATWGQQEVPSSRPWGTPLLVGSNAIIEDAVDGAGGGVDPRVGEDASVGGAPSSTAATAGSAEADSPSAGDVSAAGDAATTVDNVSGGEPGGQVAGDSEAGAGGVDELPPMPPEMELVPPLVHASPGEDLPRGAKLYEGRVYMVVYDEPAPDISPDDLPTELVHELLGR